MYNSIFKSTVTYGVETWKFNKNLESKFMSIGIGKMFQIRNNIIRGKINIKNSVLAYMKYKKLNWHGYLQIMNEERLPCKIMEWCPRGKRGRRKGRSRNSLIAGNKNWK